MGDLGLTWVKEHPWQAAAIAGAGSAVFTADATFGAAKLLKSREDHQHSQQVTNKAVADVSSAGFHDLNWADPRDNYAHDAVVPTGLSTADDYATTRDKADRVLAAFQSITGANTLRLPVNPYSVGNAWWQSYVGAIDAALGRNMKVILGYWEADKDGKIDNSTAWSRMWQTVVSHYGSQPNVYFEPMNEPFGYKLDEWVKICASWIATHPQVPRSRVVVSGTGFNDDVTGVGAAPELRETLLSLHFYGYWAGDTTMDAWTRNLARRVGRFASRTIIDEAGAPMDSGLDYSKGDGNQSTAYFMAVTNFARNNRMGLVYWPGLRGGDPFSLLKMSNAGNLVVFSVNNDSGLARLRSGWNL